MGVPTRGSISNPKDWENIFELRRMHDEENIFFEVLYKNLRNFSKPDVLRGNCNEKYKSQVLV